MEHSDRSPLASEFRDDPDMAELLELFVTELPERIDVLRAAVASDDLESVARLAHQLKGAAPGYGYPSIGESAAAVESMLRGSAAASVDAMRREVDRLIDLCERATLAV